MLFLLTGDIQIGKTRWLEALVSELQDAGVACEGVIAPGIWREHAGSEGRVTYEKLGIENVLLPQGERIRFAMRRDLARALGTEDAESQSTRAGLGWEIDDSAIARVNAHFASLRTAERAEFLVIDELGRLELLRAEGLTEAVALLESGPQGRCKHALVVVRETLVDLVEQRFANTWGGSVRIGPDEDARTFVFGKLNQNHFVSNDIQWF